MQSGEMDWFENPPPEILQLLRRNRQVSVTPLNPLPLSGIMRFNHLQPPFDRKAIRQAFLPAVNQEDAMIAVVGTEKELYKTDVGVFTPGTPLANDAGLDLLKGPRSIDRAKQMLQAAGYRNEQIRLLAPTDIVTPAALSQVAGDMLRRMGVNLDMVQMDWGTAVQRRASREPLDKGGWSVLCTAFDAFDFLKLAKKKLKTVEMDEAFLSRAVNVGFSGGEKKRNEIFQMALLDPKLCVLDETDSGLDIDALRVVAGGVNALRDSERGFLVVTHYQRLLNYIVPDFVHVMVAGRIVKSGGKELALELEARGYAWILEEVGASA